jgi:hypothetical protein
LSDDEEEEASMMRNVRVTIKNKMVTKRKQEMTTREMNTEDGDKGDQVDVDNELQQEEREGFDKEEERRQRSRK